MMFALAMLPLSFCCISAVASLWLLWRLGRVKGLLGKQLQLVAVADVFVVIFSFVDQVLVFSNARAPPHGDMLCFAMIGCYESGTKVALLAECHLAMGFAAATFMKVSALKLLHRSLVLVVPLGTLLGGLQVYVAGERWNPTGALICEHRHFDTVYEILAPVLLSICLVCYASSGIRLRCSAGYAAQRRTWRYGHLYLLASMMTIAPTYLFGQGGIWAETPVSYIITGSLANLRGLFNTAIYAGTRRLTSHRINMLSNDQKNLIDIGGGDLFTVQFQEQPSIVDVTPAVTWSTNVSTISITVDEEYGLHEILYMLGFSCDELHEIPRPIYAGHQTDRSPSQAVSC